MAMMMMSLDVPTATATRNPSSVVTAPPMYGMKFPKNVNTAIGSASGRPSRTMISHCVTAANRAIAPVPIMYPLRTSPER